MLKQLGSINACGIATIYEKFTPVASCLDTPNNISAAFLLYPNADRVEATFPTKFTGYRADYILRFNGLNMEYHKKFISPIPQK